MEDGRSPLARHIVKSECAFSLHPQLARRRRHGRRRRMSWRGSRRRTPGKEVAPFRADDEAAWPAFFPIAGSPSSPPPTMLDTADPVEQYSAAASERNRAHGRHLRTRRARARRLRICRPRGRRRRIRSARARRLRMRRPRGRPSRIRRARVHRLRICHPRRRCPVRRRGRREHRRGVHNGVLLYTHARSFPTISASPNRIGVLAASLVRAPSPSSSSCPVCHGCVLPPLWCVLLPLWRVHCTPRRHTGVYFFLSGVPRLYGDPTGEDEYTGAEYTPVYSSSAPCRCTPRRCRVHPCRVVTFGDRIVILLAASVYPRRHLLSLRCATDIHYVSPVYVFVLNVYCTSIVHCEVSKIGKCRIVLVLSINTHVKMYTSCGV